jgi:ubiquinone/menaquinone biosynthesis C-methylase UbiE
MNHDDHVRLIRDGVSGGGSVWADLGSGEGAFTLALADLLGSGGHIFSVDSDVRALREQRQVLQARFPAVMVEQQTADFTHPLDLPPLDGVVMANSLHFQRHKDPVLQLVRRMLKPGGRLVLVEYNADRGNWWVPHPLSYPAWEALAEANGFVGMRLLATQPSRFLREIYSALCYTRS